MSELSHFGPSSPSGQELLAPPSLRARFQLYPSLLSPRTSAVQGRRGRGCALKFWSVMRSQVSGGPKSHHRWGPVRGGDGVGVWGAKPVSASATQGWATGGDSPQDAPQHSGRGGKSFTLGPEEAQGWGLILLPPQTICPAGGGLRRVPKAPQQQKESRKGPGGSGERPLLTEEEAAPGTRGPKGEIGSHRGDTRPGWRGAASTARPRGSPRSPAVPRPLQQLGPCSAPWGPEEGGSWDKAARPRGRSSAQGWPEQPL